MFKCNCIENTKKIYKNKILMVADLISIYYSVQMLSKIFQVPKEIRWVTSNVWATSKLNNANYSYMLQLGEQIS